MSKVAVGSIIDHYKILEEIGQGGMGVVFKALNVNLDKTVAVKTIALGLASDEIFLNRFRTEARALARLHDPNIVNIYDLRLDDNQWFIVMEFVEGITLGRKIREGGAIPWRESLVIFKQMLSAIGHAHRVGIIHRDIKPNNVMITSDGTVKVTDFGLAKDKQNLNQTMVASTGGTLFYMSPEQVKGLQFTDYRSDIYALGLTFYEMLTGKIPFRKDDTDFTIREAILRRQFPIPGHFNHELPNGLNAIVMKAIEKKPENRYQSVDEMFIAIEEFEQDSGLKVRTKMVMETENDISALPQPTLDISYIAEKSKPAQASERSGTPHAPKRIWWKYLVAATIVLFFAAMVYFQKDQPAKGSVIIDSDPPGAEIRIDDKIHGRTPLHIKTLNDGEHQVSLIKEAYVNLDSIVNIEPDSLKYINFQLVSFGRLNLDLNPGNATLYIDDQHMDGGSSDHVSLPPGDHVIRLEHPDFYPINRTIEIEPGQEQNINLSMQRLPAVQSTGPAMVNIISQPDLAGVYFNDRYLGTTPFSDFNFPPGKQFITLRKAGYRDQNLEISADRSQKQIINAQLEALPASLSVKSIPEGALVWVDNQLQADLNTPAILNDISTGPHVIRVEKDGYQSFESTIIIDAGRENQIFADLIAGHGQVEISVLPWGSIYIDNELRKEETNTLFRTELTPGRHSIKVSHPIYGIWLHEILLRDGDTISLPVNFNDHVNVSVTAFDADGNPVWAEIVVDDKLTGEMTPKEISLRVGHRTIAARKEGYILVNGEKQIMIDKGPREPIKFILKKVI